MADQTVQISYIDRQDVSETFSDSVERISFDGQVWRLEFCVTRMEDPKPQAVNGKRFPACRLVLTPNAGIDLATKLKGILEMMEKQGVIQQVSQTNIFPPPGTKFS